VNPVSVANPAYLTEVRAVIREHGWMVQGVTNLGCECCPGGVPAHTEDRDPYLYTVGLTDAGLPELVLNLPGRETHEWLRFGQRLLNAYAGHSLHEELEVGRTYPAGIANMTAVIGVPTINRDGGFWLGTAYELYGRRNVRALEVQPQWAAG
jgi:hypothetical protein